jgi:hypothetical protein
MMPMQMDELRDLVDFMRGRGVASFKINDMEVKFTERAAAQAGIVGKEAQPDIPLTDEQAKKEYDALMYHSAT